MGRIMFFVIIAVITFWFISCEDATGPNEIAGSTDVEFAKVGEKTRCSIYLNGKYVDNLFDTIVVIKNENGIVTTRAKLVFDTTATKQLDTLLGTSGLANDVKFNILNTYLNKFGVDLDTTNKNAMTLTVDLKSKVTSEGIQDFMYSGGDLSKPFTIVKYSGVVGDKYEFTDKDNVKITRTIVSKSTTDDYPVGFWNIKVTQIEETKEDPMVEKIVYIANHKFGMVGAIIFFKNGKSAKLTFFPPNM